MPAPNPPGPGVSAGTRTAAARVPPTPLPSAREQDGSSCPAGSEGSKKHQVTWKPGLNFQPRVFPVRSRLLWVRRSRITRLPTAQATNRYLVGHVSLTKPSTKASCVDTESSPPEWLSPITTASLGNAHFQCSEDEREQLDKTRARAHCSSPPRSRII